MTLKEQAIRGGAPRRFLPGWRRLPSRGIVVAAVSAGVAVALAGCGPLTVTASSGHQKGGTGSGGQQTNSRTGHTSDGDGRSSHNSGTYSFTTLDNPADVTFNQLLGINNGGIIAGYFGSGAAGHPNKGYVLVRTDAGFRIMNENFPGSTQTQVTGLNDRGVTVGFWSDMNNANQMNDNFGFYWLHGQFHTVNFPTQNNASPPVNQLLGVNDQNVAVGFYTDANGNNHGYMFGIRGGWFHSVTVAGASSLTAAAINNNNDVAGFFTNAAGTTDGFLRTSRGHVYTLAYPGASMTQALGVNDSREVVGVYTVGTGNNAMTHGFTWTPERGFRSVDDPQGVGATTINGVNNEGDIVGFYTDGAGNTDGFAAAPAGHGAFPGLIGAPTPTPSTTPSSTPSSSTSATPTTTPSSSMTPTTSPTSTSTPSAGSPTSVPSFSGHGS